MQDGTWTDESTDTGLFVHTGGQDDYRNSILAVSFGPVTAIRIGYGAGSTIRNTHIYVEDAFIDFEPMDVGLAEIAEAQDFGDFIRGGAIDFQWRVRNKSDVLMEEVLVQEFSPQYLSMPSWLTHSIRGEPFIDQIVVGNLAPGASSQLITTRLNVPSGAATGGHAARLRMGPTSGTLQDAFWLYANITTGTPDPYIFDVTPNFGQPGGTITVTGVNLGTGDVLVNGVVADVISQSAAEVVVEVPEGTSGMVTFDNGSVESNGLPFTYLTVVTAQNVGMIVQIFDAQGQTDYPASLIMVAGEVKNLRYHDILNDIGSAEFWISKLLLEPDPECQPGCT
jgi:hypothetical protein